MIQSTPQATPSPEQKIPAAGVTPIQPVVQKKTEADKPDLKDKSQP